ncbi:MAG TPA: acyl carrier protein [Bacteroidales bacterium]|nr:acyl carrier protein [Bacteroidales bacterium]HQI69727.1 acyl carrier protein [Bacteroidales bacterium]
METKEKEIYSFIVARLADKLSRVGFSEKDLTPGFNLTKSGLLDSMAFVNLVADIEKNFNVQVDFEEAFQNPDFTSLSGLITVVEKQIK